MPATISASWVSEIRKGSVWKMLPERRHPAGDRAAHERRAAAGLSPVSESASETPMLIPAPSATAIPTTNAVCEFEDTAAAKIGAIEETVPSIRPTSAGLHDAQHEVALVLETPATDQREISEPARREARQRSSAGVLAATCSARLGFSRPTSGYSSSVPQRVQMAS